MSPQVIVRMGVLYGLRFYQKVLSPDKGFLRFIYPQQTCKFYPTCSDYAYKAVSRHGVLKGGWLGISRLFRCHPWSDGGVDEVPK